MAYKFLLHLTKKSPHVGLSWRKHNFRSKVNLSVAKFYVFLQKKIFYCCSSIDIDANLCAYLWSDLWWCESFLTPWELKNTTSSPIFTPHPFPSHFPTCLWRTIDHPHKLENFLKPSDHQSMGLKSPSGPYDWLVREGLIKQVEDQWSSYTNRMHLSRHQMSIFRSRELFWSGYRPKLSFFW